MLSPSKPAAVGAAKPSSLSDSSRSPKPERCPPSCSSPLHSLGSGVGRGCCRQLALCHLQLPWWNHPTSVRRGVGQGGEPPSLAELLESDGRLDVR